MRKSRAASVVNVANHRDEADQWVPVKRPIGERRNTNHRLDFGESFQDRESSPLPFTKIDRPLTAQSVLLPTVAIHT